MAGAFTKPSRYLKRWLQICRRYLLTSSYYLGTAYSKSNLSHSSSLPVALATPSFSSTTATLVVGCQFSAFSLSDRMGCEKW